MTTSFTDQLCTHCGICCDGSLFSDVELASLREATQLEALGMNVEDDALLLHPCLALDGTRCSIYAHRPETCRTFECGLLQRVQRGDTSLDQAKALVKKARTHFNQVRKLAHALRPTTESLPLKELCHEALTETEDSTPEQTRQKEVLEEAWSRAERIIDTIFLGDGMANTSS